MTRMKFTVILYLIMLAIALSGCASDSPDAAPAEAHQMVIHFSIGSGDATRAGEADPSEIHDVTVMLYAPVAQGSSVPGNLWKAIQVNTPDIEHVEGNRYNFDIRFDPSEAGTPQSIIVEAVANCSSFYNLIKSNEGRHHEYIRALLVEDVAARQAEWQRDGFAWQFSMWGICDTPIATDVNAQAVRLDLLRDWAKYQVNIDPELAEDQGHCIATTLLYNRAESFHLIPATDASGAPVLPSVPAGAKISSEQVSTMASPDSKTLSWGGIFPEQDVLMGSLDGDPDDDNRYLRPAIIVGLWWKGSSRCCYYRLDFLDGERLADAERNHKFVYNITAVKGPGADTPEEAYKSISSSVTATVTLWTDIENDVMMDGSNWVSMPRTVTIGPSAGDSAPVAFSTNVETSFWQLAWCENDAEYEDLVFHGADSPLTDAEGCFRVSLSGNPSAPLRVEALKELTQPGQSRKKQLYISITDALRIVVTIIQLAPSSEADTADWETTDIYNTL